MFVFAVFDLALDVHTVFVNQISNTGRQPLTPEKGIRIVGRDTSVLCDVVKNLFLLRIHFLSPHNYKSLRRYASTRPSFCKGNALAFR